MIVSSSPLARKLGAFVNLSEPELAVLANLHGRRKSFSAGRDMVHQGQADQSAYVLAEGWVCSYRLLPGGGRQIVDFQIPGDFLGLRTILYRSAGQSIEPLTQVQASVVSGSDLMDVFARNPRLGTAVLWAASRDDAMVVEHLVGIGRRNVDHLGAQQGFESAAEALGFFRDHGSSFECQRFRNSVSNAWPAGQSPRPDSALMWPASPRSTKREPQAAAKAWARSKLQ